MSKERIEHMRKKGEETRLRRLAEGLPARSTPEERLANKPNSLRLAVNCKCRSCEGLQDPHPSWRIGNCPVKSCPLWTVRPHQKLFGKPTPPSLEGA